MNAVVPSGTPGITADGSAECVAFVGDNQTFGVVSMVLEQYFETPLVRDGDTKDALEYLAQVDPPQVIIVDLSGTSELLTDLMTLTSVLTDETRLIGIGTVNDINMYRDLVEAGISDYLVKPITEKSLAVALESLNDPKSDSAQAKAKKAQRIVVIGARGGVGSSAISVTLAWLIAEEQKQRTALIDLDLEFGTIALALDLEPTHGLREALENPSRLDSLFISSAMAKVNERLSVLATEETMAGDVEFNPAAIEILFETLSRNHDVIVVDLPRSAVGFRHRVLQAATQIVLVTDLTLASLRDSIRLLSMVEESAGGKPITIVANRAGGKAESMNKTDFQKTLGRAIDHVILEERKAMKQAADAGKPLPVAVKSARTVIEMRSLARKIVPAKRGKKGALKSGWRFFRVRGKQG